MKKVKKATFFLFLLLSVTVCLLFGGKIVKAETLQDSVCYATGNNEEITPLGIFTKLEFSLYGENGQVMFTAKNKFTLFPATVTVNLELYRSDTYQDDFANMTLVATNYIGDLDQGETLTASASTEGRQSYWKARAYYKIDKKDTQEYIRETVLCNADGIVVFN